MDRCNGWIELRPEQAWSMGRCTWEGAEAEFEGVWSSNSVGYVAACTKDWWLLSRAQSARSLNGGLMLPILPGQRVESTPHSAAKQKVQILLPCGSRR